MCACMFSLLKPVLRCYSTKILKYILDYKRRRRKRKKEKQMKEGGDNKQEGGGEERGETPSPLAVVEDEVQSSALQSCHLATPSKHSLAPRGP